LRIVGELRSPDAKILLRQFDVTLRQIHGFGGFALPHILLPILSPMFDTLKLLTPIKMKLKLLLPLNNY
jgi:hypothetical protein